MLTAIHKYLSTANKFVKYLVSFAAVTYILYRFTNTSFNSQELLSFLTPFTFFAVLCCSLGNWIFEILKWKIAIGTFQHISFGKATYQTLVAYTYGLVTPFNSGNYLKKMLFFSKEHSKKVVFLNLSKGLYQMITTLLFGTWGLYFLVDKIDTRVFNQQTFLLITSFIGLIVLVVFRKKITLYFKEIPLRTHVLLFVFSVFKYLCFSLLLLILLQQQNTNFTELYAAIAIVYLLSSLLPILNILDFAIKGSMALFVLVPIGYNDAHILIAYFILWLCNHAAPAFTGSFLQFYQQKNQTV